MKNFNLLNDKGSIRLRFSVDGVRFSLAPIPGGQFSDKHDRQMAEAIATKIKNDIRAGYFDPSLERYRHKPSQVLIQNPKSKILKKSTLEIWDAWVASLVLPDHTKSDHYQCVRRQIQKAGNPKPNEGTGWFENAKLASSTYNRRLNMLRSAFAWAIEEGLTLNNPWLKIKERRGGKRAEVKPFTATEIELILQEFSKTFPHYRGFVEFLFLSGCRTGEAVGLRWGDVDLHRGVITIRESMSRKRGGYEKTRKSTKTETVRSLQMSDRIKNLLISLSVSSSVNSENLIFTTPKGCVIDHGNFRVSYWKPVLKKLGLPYRKPYSTRHTLLSHALESGLSVLQVAQLAGHSDGRMVLQHYGHVINSPKLPEL